MCVWITFQTRHHTAWGYTTQQAAQKPGNPKWDESGMGRDESAMGRDESAMGWDESAARAGRQPLLSAPRINHKQEPFYGDQLLVDGPSGGSGAKRLPPEAWVAKHSYPPADGQPVELYDLKADSGQRRNLAALHLEKVAKLTGLLKHTRHQQRSATLRSPLRVFLPSD